MNCVELDGVDADSIITFADVGNVTYPFSVCVRFRADNIAKRTKWFPDRGYDAR